MTPLVSVLEFHYTRFGNLGIEAMKCFYSQAALSEDCQNRVRDMFQKTTLGVGAILFPAINEKFMVFEYLQSGIKVTLNLGSCFPSFIEQGLVEDIIEKLKPLFDMCRDLIEDMLQMYIGCPYALLIDGSDYEVAIKDAEKNTDWLKHLPDQFKLVLAASRSHFDSGDCPELFKETFELVEKVLDQWGTFI